MKKFFLAIIILILIVGLLGIGINGYILGSGKQDIAQVVDSPELFLEEESLETLKDLDADCILVLGAAVHGNTPSKMLRDRLDVAIALYQQGVAPKLLLTGDNGQVEYNEVEVMKTYVQEAGVPAEDVFLDHAGFSTYESMYRAGSVFQVEKVVVVTQKYHMYRALLDARFLDLEALGVASDQKEYSGQTYRDLREIAARIKDFGMVIWKPEPTYLGDPIPIDGDGRQTQ